MGRPPPAAHPIRTPAVAATDHGRRALERAVGTGCALASRRGGRAPTFLDHAHEYRTPLASPALIMDAHPLRAAHPHPHAGGRGDGTRAAGAGTGRWHTRGIRAAGRIVRRTCATGVQAARRRPGETAARRRPQSRRGEDRTPRTGPAQHIMDAAPSARPRIPIRAPPGAAPDRGRRGAGTGRRRRLREAPAMPWATGCAGPRWRARAPGNPVILFFVIRRRCAI
jgi:hypothetical protein